MSEPPGVALLGPADVRELAHSLDLRPTKARGQNFVIDANTVRRIVARAQVQPEDVVLEVGPGLGSLTLGLLGVAREVIAVEIEQVLANQLPITVADFAPARADRLRVVHTDALQLLTLADPQPTALVANLPYNVAVPVLLESLARFLTLDHGLVMVQKEVADRLCAAPGSKLYGAPTVKLRWYAEVDSAGGVSSSVFWPAPRVASGLVAFRCYPRHDDRALRERAFAAVDAAFGHRRKMLRSALASWAGSTSAAVAAMREAEIDPTARGEQLDASAFRRLAEVLPRPVAGD